jgi:Flp pilus assembly protein TadD
VAEPPHGVDSKISQELTEQQKLLTAPPALVRYDRPMAFIKDLAECEKAVERSPESAEARLDLAAALMPYGRVEDASREAREAVRLRPDWADAYISAGFADLLLARYDDARAAFERAVALDAKQPLARYGLARACVFLGDRAGAQAQLEILEKRDDLPPNLVADLRAGVDALQ